MTVSRCGLPDVHLGIEAATVCWWDQRGLTYAFDVGTADIAGNAEFQAVRNAFQTWSAAVPIVFTEVAVNGNPDILVGWPRKRPRSQHGRRRHRRLLISPSLVAW